MVKTALHPQAPLPPDFSQQVLVPLRAAQVRRAQEEEQARQAAAAEAARVAAEAAAAQAAREAQAAAQAQAAVVATTTGSHDDWMAAAGIAQSDYGYVDFIISHESSWNPSAINASSGAGGLPQALPFSKTGCSLGDPVCQLRWADGYATARYGSWAGAYTFWQAHRYW